MPPMLSCNGPVGVWRTIGSPTRALKFSAKLAETMTASPRATRSHTSAIRSPNKGHCPSSGWVKYVGSIASIAMDLPE